MYSKAPHCCQAKPPVWTGAQSQSHQLVPNGFNSVNIWTQRFKHTACTPRWHGQTLTTLHQTTTAILFVCVLQKNSQEPAVCTRNAQSLKLQRIESSTRFTARRQPQFTRDDMFTASVHGSVSPRQTPVHFQQTKAYRPCLVYSYSYSLQTYCYLVLFKF